MEKPIIFSTPMVQAILTGRKTQTRRIVKLGCQAFTICEKTAIGQFLFKEADNFLYDVPKIPYQPGDVLWVRESFCLGYFGKGTVAYKADYDKKKIGDVVPTPKWRPSIYMPRAAARIFLRVTDVRVERVQEISKEDAIKEGFEGVPCSCNRIACTDCMNTGWLEPPTVDFMYTWDSLNTKRKVKKYSENPMIAMQQNIINQQNDFSWDSNPFVWVISFERVEP